MTDPRDVTETMHEEFYRFIANAYDKPRYHFHYKTDAPLNIRALFYVPEYKPSEWDIASASHGAISNKQLHFAHLDITSVAGMA